MNVGTGDNVLIGGFIVVGTEPKKVLLRAIGPSLTAFGVLNALADPIIELHKPGNIVVTNDNWKDTQEPEIMDTGIAPTDDLESAILATLDPGLYTAIVQGKNGGTGVGLVEVYDLDEAADSELANISTRGFVDIDENVMIGGFIVGNGVSTSVVVRAIGPSLSASGSPIRCRIRLSNSSTLVERSLPLTMIGRTLSKPKSKPPAWHRSTIANRPSQRILLPAPTPQLCAGKTTPAASD